MFSNIRKEIIRELYNQYQDSNTVTNILLDSIDLESSPDNDDKQLVFSNFPILQTSNEIKFDLKVKSLKQLCTERLKDIDYLFDKYYHDNDVSDLNNSNSNINFPIHSTESSVSIENNNGNQLEIKDDFGIYSDEPLLNLNLQSSFLKVLIELFGKDEDVKYLENSKYYFKIFLFFNHRILRNIHYLNFMLEK